MTATLPAEPIGFSVLIADDGAHDRVCFGDWEDFTLSQSQMESCLTLFLPPEMRPIDIAVSCEMQ